MESISEFHLKNYYNNHFPFDSIREWISYDGKEPLNCRECAFWYDSQRFNRWANIDDMKRVLASTTQSPPERMEIGPVYNHPIKERSSVPLGEFFAIHRELVFDIDSDDFKDIKDCCGDSEICPKCWIYMNCALNCLTEALTKNFGFKYILPVFSGRRGVHIWVCDKKARELSQNVRQGIVSYLNLNEIAGTPGFKPMSCPFAQQMLPLCEDYFIQIAEEYSIFTNTKLTEVVKKLIGEKFFNAINIKLSEYQNQSFRAQWNAIKQKPLVDGSRPFNETPNYYKLIFQFSFPRLDANVTITMNHLLKSPFSFHPKSGLISLPIPKEKFGQYPPDWVPNLLDLLNGDENAKEAYKEAVNQFNDFRKSTLKEKG